jgi:hypothetical protein
MAEHGLKDPADLEELSAWMDGQLPQERARLVAQRVAALPDWQATYQQFLAVDAALGLLKPACPRGELAGRIVAAARRQRRLRQVVRAGTPVAAAACLVLGLWVAWGRLAVRHPGVPAAPQDGTAALAPVKQDIARTLGDVPEEDRFIVQNLSLFQDYPELTEYQKVRALADAQTLSALAELEARGKL